jgi:hypothetical protein
MIEIENDIPIPPKTPKAGRKGAYPFAELEVGQSFFVPAPPGKTNRQLQMAISGSAQHITKKTGHRFTSRTVDGGIRVWRFA